MTFQKHGGDINFIKPFILQDGRLRVNDQLLAVNNTDLRELMNSQAMETLRDAMLIDRPTPGHIKLTIGMHKLNKIDVLDLSEHAMFVMDRDYNGLTLVYLRFYLALGLGYFI